MELIYTDEEMDEHFTERGYDGRWSLTTQLSLISLKAEQVPLYLNYLWAVTPQNFLCPICKRSKPTLMRRMQQRVVAYLCIDHDHLGDFLTSEARSLKFRGDLRQVYDRLMSFRPVIICNQCNAIDSIIKAKLPDIDRRFTFTPEHKRELFKPYKRAHHWVNLVRAEKIWRAEEPSFRAKLGEVSRALEQISYDSASPWWPYQRYIDEEIKRLFREKFPNAPAEAYARFIHRSIASGCSRSEGYDSQGQVASCSAERS